MRKKTTEEFIQEAKEKHGGKYDYSNVDYVNYHTKVCIVCHKPGHGEFWQKPKNHLSGCGCPKCCGVYVPTTEEWIASAHEVHNGKYDYSKVKYINAFTKVCIKCPEHGEFWQNPKHHLSGCGCPKCCGVYVPTTEEWIASAHEVHNGKYDYSKVKYINAFTKVCIICPEHGEFEQIPNNHLQGQGCPKCCGVYVPTTEEWIASARKVHGDKYDYSKAEYVNSKTKVCIICPKHGHGEFWQNPKHHLSGCGCPKCCGVYVPTTEEWIASARKVHGDKYDYSKAEYVNSKTKVCIICPKHGEFEQTPNKHTKGHGCPKCNLSHLELSVMNYLDEAGITYDYQKHFDWLWKQSLDFYLPDYNVGVECQGEQHFFPVEHFGGDEGFKKILERDKRKFKKCQKNGIKILYYSNLGIEYPYDVFEDVDFLFEEIKNSRF